MTELLDSIACIAPPRTTCLRWCQTGRYISSRPTRRGGLVATLTATRAGSLPGGSGYRDLWSLAASRRRPAAGSGRILRAAPEAGFWAAEAHPHLRRLLAPERHRGRVRGTQFIFRDPFYFQTGSYRHRSGLAR